MIDLKSIKLIVWDLDETFWSGTLSEGGAIVPDEHLKLIRDLTDCGIINSICSKNDFESTKQFILNLGVWDLFVFPSINWDSKGPQLKEKIDKMALRPVNVLFIDDNDSNLGEAKHYLPTIQTGNPEIIQELIRQVDSYEKKDIQHKRLKQYKILEEKDSASKSYMSNEAFLFDSQIQVEVSHDCLQHIQRIHELLLRSNQLNYTKKRISIDELSALLNDPEYDCGYVTVKDRFGDYGLVGFYAKKDNYLEHFLFSCRTMGQKIEQWVYAQLGFPDLEVCGEVRTQLNKTECPGWINQEAVPSDSTQDNQNTADRRCRVLLKGPCDLSHSQVYIKKSIPFDTDFTYTDDRGRIIDSYNHSVHIEGLYTYSEEDKRTIVEDCVFVDPSMLSGRFFTGEYDLIFLSTFIESTYQIYQKKGSNIRVVFGGNALTNEENWEGYISGLIYNRGNSFSLDYLKSFSQKYECIGQTTPEMYELFLRKCLKWLPDRTILCLILGATQGFDGDEAEKERHVKLNEMVKSFAKSNPRIRYIEVDNCIHDSGDFENSINHFSARVYYEIAQRMLEVVRQETGQNVESYSESIVFFDRIVLRLRKIIKSVISPQSGLYRVLKQPYNRIYKKRG